MKKIKWDSGAMMAPVPITLVSCGTLDNPNAFTVAWTGIINSTPAKTYISVRPSRHSYKMIKESGEFVINIPNSYLIKIVDFCGVKSGSEIKKFEVCNITAVESSVIKAPMIDECPLSIECRVTEIVPLGSHDMFIADIVAVNVDETLIDEKGKLRLERASLAAYAHGDYFALGKKIGYFGYSVRKKRERRDNKK